MKLLTFRLVWLVAGGVGVASAGQPGAASNASAGQPGAASVASAGQPGAASPASACRMVDDDYIRGADLAAAMPAFGKLNPAMEIGIAPLPGIKRVFHPADLEGLARENGIELAASPTEVCFERAGGLVRTAKARAALAPVAVKRGDRVAVTVSSGGVVLKFESEAESSGRPGDIVIVRNPENGNRFAARVEDQGKVIVNK